MCSKNGKNRAIYCPYPFHTTFPLIMNALVYVDIDQGIYKVKLKVALNEKRKKLRGFSFCINIANFKAFHWTKKLISNLFFLKSGYIIHRYVSYLQYSNLTNPLGIWFSVYFFCNLGQKLIWKLRIWLKS